MVEPQPLQSVLGDQLPDQAMEGIERAGILDPQSRERVDVEEAPIVDVAGSQPPMPELVVLAFEQMMQGEDLRGTIRSGAVSLQAARDDVRAASDGFQFRLEGGRFLAIGMA